MRSGQSRSTAAWKSRLAAISVRTSAAIPAASPASRSWSESQPSPIRRTTRRTSAAPTRLRNTERAALCGSPVSRAASRAAPAIVSSSSTTTSSSSIAIGAAGSSWRRATASLNQSTISVSPLMRATSGASGAAVSMPWRNPPGVVKTTAVSPSEGSTLPT